jgi:hypothetical protein
VGIHEEREIAGGTQEGNSDKGVMWLYCLVFNPHSVFYSIAFSISSNPRQSFNYKIRLSDTLWAYGERLGEIKNMCCEKIDVQSHFRVWVK